MRVDVDPILRRVTVAGRSACRSSADRRGPAASARRHPDEVARTGRHFGGRSARDDDIAARAVDLVGERQRDGLAATARSSVAVEVTIRATWWSCPRAGRAPDRPGRPCRWRSGRKSRGRSRLGRLTHCTGMRKGWPAACDRTRHGFQMSSSAGPSYQGMFSLRRRDIVALAARHRDRGEIASMPMSRRSVDSRRRSCRRPAGRNPPDPSCSRPARRADAEQVREIAVAAGLREHALARIDQDHRQIGGGRAGRPCCGCIARGPGYRRR